MGKIGKWESSSGSTPKSPAECSNIGDFRRFLKAHGMNINDYWGGGEKPFKTVLLGPEDFRWIADNASNLNRDPKQRQMTSIAAQLEKGWTNGLTGSHMFFDSTGMQLDGGHRTWTFARALTTKIPIALWYGGTYEDSMEQLNAAQSMRSGERLHRLLRINEIQASSGAAIDKPMAAQLSSAAQMLYAIECGLDVQLNNICDTHLFEYITKFRCGLIDAVEWARDAFGPRTLVHIPTIAAMKVLLPAIDEKLADNLFSGMIGCTTKSIPQPVRMLVSHFSPNGGHRYCNKAKRRDQTWAFLKTWIAIQEGRDIEKQEHPSCCELDMRPKRDTRSMLMAMTGEVHSSVRENALGTSIHGFTEHIAGLQHTKSVAMA